MFDKNLHEGKDGETASEITNTQLSEENKAVTSRTMTGSRKAEDKVQLTEFFSSCFSWRPIVYSTYLCPLYLGSDLNVKYLTMFFLGMHWTRVLLSTNSRLLASYT